MIALYRMNPKDNTIEINYYEFIYSVGKGRAEERYG
jgi:hypothetical protein